MAAASKSPMTLETIRQIAERFPGMEEGLMFGSPCFRVRGKFIAGAARFEGTWCFKLHENERTILLDAEPEKYFITDHYKPVTTNGITYIVARLDQIDAMDVEMLLEQAYLLSATKKQIAEYKGAE
jgi:hypothetical protein